MLAFHNLPDLKSEAVRDLNRHRKADDFIRGTYGDYDEDGRFRGCLVGCALAGRVPRGEEGEHVHFETVWGIPQALAVLFDDIYEGLPEDAAMAWPVRSMSAIPVGADLSMVVDRFLHWLLVAPRYGVIHRAVTDGGRKAITDVADLYARKIAGDTPDVSEWRVATPAADATVRAAAYAAAAVAAAAVAVDAAYVGDAAYAALYHIHANAPTETRQSTRAAQANQLVKLMKAAPIP